MAVRETANGPADPQRDPSTAGWGPPDEFAATASAPGKSTPDPHRAGHSTSRDRTDHLGTDEPATDPDPGVPTVPGYRVIDVLGRGGMGTVYRAVHVEMNREVALKLISPGGRDEYAVRGRFDREVRALAGLDHPNIVPIYDAGYVHGFPFFTMKLVPGGALGKHLGRFRNDLPAACRLVAKVARAVDRLHAAGVVHRDLKPLNILLGENDEPLVADFGLARWMDDDSELTASGFPVGTRPYMSPEQSLGSKTDYTPACDIWALGIVLYEVLTGQRPFDDADPVTLYIRIRSEPPPPLAGVNPAVPRELEAVVRKCLAKRPEDRYPTAAAVADDLDWWAGGQPVSVTPAEADTAAFGPASVPRRRWGVARATAFALAFVGVAAAGSVPRPDRQPGGLMIPPIAFRTIADRLTARETVDLIGPMGPPLLKHESAPHLEGTVRLGTDGYCAVIAPDFGTVELSRETLPLPVRLEGEVRLDNGLPLGSAAAGFYVGRQETRTADGLHQTAVTVTQQVIPQPTPRKEPAGRIVVPKPGQPAAAGPAPAPTPGRPRVTITLRPQAQALWRLGPNDGQVRGLGRSIGEVREQLDDPARWHRWEVTVTADRLLVAWDGRELPPVTTAEVATARARNVNSLTDRLTVPNPPFAGPALGPGLGLYVQCADASYRNVRLVPLPRP